MNHTIPLLDAAEQRVLGSLIEKSRTTPDYYPMTINSLMAACNQKTSRNPIVQYVEAQIVNTLDTLKRKGLISTATGGTSRVLKFKHNLAILYPLVPSELAIICLLLLRGSQTPGEINTNSSRLYEFETLDEVNALLQKLSDPELAFIKALERRPGQKEVRYIHLLGDVMGDVQEIQTERTSTGDNKQLEERVSTLETQLRDLRNEFDKLMKELS
ncbi:MAG: YceH family protein [Daejeonella sp.]|uniref:YceH family protein n=1 Tax=Daejeonella sp. TaxID=2805397 RepID=UPI003C7551F4